MPKLSSGQVSRHSRGVDAPKFQIIPGGKADKGKPKRKPRAKTGPTWHCRRRIKDTGQMTSTFLRVTTDPMDLGDRLVGGKANWICVHCLSRGVVSHQTV